MRLLSFNGILYEIGIDLCLCHHDRFLMEETAQIFGDLFDRRFVDIDQSQDEGVLFGVFAVLVEVGTADRGKREGNVIGDTDVFQYGDVAVRFIELLTDRGVVESDVDLRFCHREEACLMSSSKSLR